MERYSLEKAQNEGAEIRKRALKRLSRLGSYVPPSGEPQGALYGLAHRTLEFTAYESEKIKEWAMELVESWHDNINPDYIFVTDTSAVRYGYVLKEAWKKAYPDEKAPVFYRINPMAPIIRGESYNERLRVWEATKISKEDIDAVKSEFF